MKELTLRIEIQNEDRDDADGVFLCSSNVTPYLVDKAIASFVSWQYFGSNPSDFHVVSRFGNLHVLPPGDKQAYPHGGTFCNGIWNSTRICHAPH